MREHNPEKVGEDLPIDLLFEVRHPINLELGGFDPANISELRRFGLNVEITIVACESDEEIGLLLAVESFLGPSGWKKVTTAKGVFWWAITGRADPSERSW